MVAKLHALKAELRFRMHEPVAAVGAWLRKVVNGYYRYHAVPGNIGRLSLFGQRLRRLWRPSQSTTHLVGPGTPDLQAMASSPTRFASLSCSSLSRYSSKVGAVCVEALVRICAGGVSDGRPYRVTWHRARSSRDLLWLRIRCQGVPKRPTPP
jgi:hypothetical protein